MFLPLEVAKNRLHICSIIVFFKATLTVPFLDFEGFDQFIESSLKRAIIFSVRREWISSVCLF